MEVLVDDGVEQLRIVVFLNAEGLGHEGRVYSVLLGDVFELLLLLFGDGSVLYFLEVAEDVSGAFLHVFALLFDLFNGGQVRKLHRVLLVHIVLHQPAFPLPFALLLLLLLPLPAQPLLLGQPQPLLLLFLLPPPPPLLLLEEEVLVNHLDLLLVEVELRQVLQVLRQRPGPPVLARLLGKRRVEVPEPVEVVDEGDLLAEELLLLPLVELGVVALLLDLVEVAQAGERVVELVVGEPLEVGLVLDHLREVGVLLGARVDHQQDGQQDVQQERVDGVDQRLVVLPLDVHHVPAYEQHWEQAEQGVQEGELGRRGEQLCALDEEGRELVAGQEAAVEQPEEREGEEREGEDCSENVQVAACVADPLRKTVVRLEVVSEPHREGSAQERTCDDADQADSQNDRKRAGLQQKIGSCSRDGQSEPRDPGEERQYAAEGGGGLGLRVVAFGVEHDDCDDCEGDAEGEVDDVADR